MSTWDDKPNDHEHAIVVIADLLRRELRLVPGEGKECKCGEWVGTWRVKDGNIEHCARLIAETLAEELATEREITANLQWTIAQLTRG